MVAFDVKAKTIYPEGLIFDLDEVRKLRNFARLFDCTVYFACPIPRAASAPAIGYASTSSTTCQRYGAARC